jgi:type VI secretion system (T6SS) effector TldE1-like protein
MSLGDVRYGHPRATRRDDGFSYRHRARAYPLEHELSPSPVPAPARVEARHFHDQTQSRVRDCLLGVGIAAAVASAVAFAPIAEVAARWTQSGATDARVTESAFAAIYADSEDDGAPVAAQKRVHLASAAADITGTVSARNAGLASSLLTDDGASFRQRFYSSYGDRSSSFEDRFGPSAEGDPEPAPRATQGAPSLPTRVDAPRRANTRLAMLSPTTESAPNKATRSVTDPTRTAIYDISARTVYLPNGDRLEAHSGFGEHMDDVRSVRLKMRGVTPPNVYELTERERLFHGVRAIRLNPVDGDKMYGRAGILAHSYLLGPSGQSNGCVSFKDYPKFLNAFLNGEIDRLVVVERLDEPPPANTAVGWITDKVKAFFKAS